MFLTSSQFPLVGAPLWTLGLPTCTSVMTSRDNSHVNWLTKSKKSNRKELPPRRRSRIEQYGTQKKYCSKILKYTEKVYFLMFGN